MKDLMIPRYEVIADYPNNDEYPVGSIKENIGESYCKFLDQYPHLFRKLEWWEKRTVEEMPQYLKFHDNEIIKVKNWNMEILWCEREDGGGCSLGVWSKGYGYTPATETEYNDYIKPNQP